MSNCHVFSMMFLYARLRIGDYRVVFYEEEGLILISKIAHRKQVYL
jgi:mRNA-degrading endonuclease RelE of RelBE toxin-antitoxin system